MNKKITVIGLIVFSAFLILLMFSQIQYRKAFPPEPIDREEIKAIEKEEEITATSFTEKDIVSDKGKKKTQQLGQISLREIKQKGVEKQKEEFDLTPSVDELIEMEKERIKVY